MVASRRGRTVRLSAVAMAALCTVSACGPRDNARMISLYTPASSAATRGMMFFPLVVAGANTWE